MKSLWLGVASVLMSSASAETVSLRSLLTEMADEDALTRLSESAFTMRLWSSHDRASVAPGRSGWFANADSGQFVRAETNAEGKVERVLMDAKGPGAIVRFWITVDRIPDGGTLRFYIDGQKAIEGKSFDVLSGGALCGAPLSASVSPRSPLNRRGHDLYLPIPYAKSCKVTVEYDVPSRCAFYYNVETRSYVGGTAVESFSKSALEDCRELIARVNAAWAAGTERPLPTGCESQALSDFKLKPGDEKSFVFKGPGAVREIALDCDFRVWTPQLPMPRDVFVKIDFDGERTVEAPLTAFFGVGPSLRDFNTRFTSFKGNVFKARWPMPFRESARIALCNGGSGALSVRSFAVSAGDYGWQEGRSLHFAAAYKPYRQIRTRMNGDHRDLNYLTVSGRSGRLVGCGVSILNPAPMWWGEGDEKIYVDGERTPSYIGTGTEDFYGYAWCRPEVFSHPLLAQPDGSGNMAPGVAVNLRHRVLDAIPFKTSLVFDMELWHWRDCVVDYETCSWYYVK